MSRTRPYTDILTRTVLYYKENMIIFSKDVHSVILSSYMSLTIIGAS